MRVNREDERVGELAWKLVLREKEILLWARLMEEMINVREIMDTVRSECSKIQYSIVFRFGFSNLIRPGMGQESNGRRHGMAQALDLPLHEVIAKSRVINNSCTFMLIVCACTV